LCQSNVWLHWSTWVHLHGFVLNIPMQKRVLWATRWLDVDKMSKSYYDDMSIQNFTSCIFQNAFSFRNWT
jgi:hypothetical protein